MSQNPHLPKSLADLLAATPAVSNADLQRLKKAGDEIERDPASRAELQKALFVNAILSALKSEKITQSELARRMKCARQYVSSMLAEDSSVNFTIETLSTVAAACNRRAEIVVLAGDEWVKVVKNQRNTVCEVFGEKNFSPVNSVISYSLKINTETVRANNITTHDFTAQPTGSPVKVA